MKTGPHLFLNLCCVGLSEKRILISEIQIFSPNIAMQSQKTFGCVEYLHV